MQIDDQITNQSGRPIDLAIVLPTFNERDNVDELIARLSSTLSHLSWEIIFVDDDSTDGTSSAVSAYARADHRIRLIHRIGRRGLSTACMEGILATSANYVAVMDADLQHDESILPEMYRMLRDRNLDIVIGTRNAQGGSMGDFSSARVLLSKAGQAVSRLVSRCKLSDPMSGFFLVRRSFFLASVRNMQGGGFKILLDLLASSPQPAHVGEVGYCFRTRKHGESKLDLNTGIEYFFLLLNKITHGLIPARFALFCLVGATGILTHLLCLSFMLHHVRLNFFQAQLIAAGVAMTENFFINNLVTFRDRRLKGFSLVLGLVSYWFACSFGAWASAILAYALFSNGIMWPLAGLAGVVVGSVWNYSMTSLFTWQKKKRPSLEQQAPVAETTDLQFHS